jgi:hypothetical protein
VVRKELADDPGQRYADMHEALDGLAGEGNVAQLAEGPGPITGWNSRSLRRGLTTLRKLPCVRARIAGRRGGIEHHARHGLGRFDLTTVPLDELAFTQFAGVVSSAGGT